MKITFANRMVPALAYMKIAGGAGAFAGGVTAAYHCMPMVYKKRMKLADAGKIVLREAAGTGVASGIGAGAMAALGIGGIAGLAGFILVATIVKDRWDDAFEPKQREEKKMIPASTAPSR